jgi:hypothetical protein
LSMVAENRQVNFFELTDMWSTRSTSSTFIPSLIAILWNEYMFYDLQRIKTVMFVRSGDAPSIFDEHL